MQPKLNTRQPARPADGFGLYQLGYMRGVSDLISILVQVVTEEQARAIQELYQRLRSRKPEGGEEAKNE